MTWIDAIVAMLVSRGLGTTGTTFFIGPTATVPDVDTAVAIFAEANAADPSSVDEGRLQAALASREILRWTSALYVHNDPRTPALTRPRLQVTTRARLRVDARLLAQQIHDALLSVTNDDLADLRFLKIRPVQEPFDLPPDAGGRARFDCHYEALLRQS